MKFGTTTVPIAGWVVDPRDPSGMRQKRLEAVERIVSGYDLEVVELSLDLGMIYSKIFDKDFFQSVADLQKQLDFACTVHLPFLWLDPASFNEPVRQASVESIRQAVGLVKPLFIDTYVLHLWGNTTIQISNLMNDSLHKEMFLETILAQADKSLDEIKEFINPYNICIETLEAPDFDFILPLIEKHGTSICLDIGKLAWQGGGEVSFLDRNAEHIREIHLHDASVEIVGGEQRVVDHLALGKGQIDYRNFMQKLLELGFDGIVILENNTRSDLERSIARIGDYL